MIKQPIDKPIDLIRGPKWHYNWNRAPLVTTECETENETMWTFLSVCVYWVHDIHKWYKQHKLNITSFNLFKNVNMKGNLSTVMWTKKQKKGTNDPQNSTSFRNKFCVSSELPAYYAGQETNPHTTPMEPSLWQLSGCTQSLVRDVHSPIAWSV